MQFDSLNEMVNASGRESKKRKRYSFRGPDLLKYDNNEERRMLSSKRNTKRKKLLTALVIFLFIIELNIQEVTCSRRFLTGLIIGTLLSK